MSGASTSTYPENLGSGGQLPAELRGRVSLFCLFVRHATLHRKPRRCVYVLNLGGTGIRPTESFSYRSSFRFRSRSSSCSTTSGDIFYCSGSRQLNHSSFKFYCMFYFTCDRSLTPRVGAAAKAILRDYTSSNKQLQEADAFEKYKLRTDVL